MNNGRGGFERKPDFECDPKYLKRRAYFKKYMHDNKDRYAKQARDRRIARLKAAGKTIRRPYIKHDDTKLDLIAMQDPTISKGRNAQVLKANMVSSESRQSHVA